MPRATVSNDTVDLPLQTLEGGFVKLKRMSYGKWLERTEMAMKIQFASKNKETAGNVEMANKAVTVFEFTNCIVEHNLTDENDQPLNLNTPTSLDNLDPKIGNEIAAKITEMHEFDLPN